MFTELQMLAGSTDTRAEKVKNMALSIHFMRTAIPAKCYENVVFEKSVFQPG